MVSFKRYILFLNFLVISTMLSSCSTVKKEISNTKLPDYPEVVVLESLQNDSNIYSIRDGNLSKVGDVSTVSEVAYDSDHGVYVYINNMSLGNNLAHSKIEILRKSGESIINNFYSASDIRLSPDASKLALRTYAGDSMQSAKGLKVYSIDKGKYLNMSSKVLISGNLYRWIDDNEIMYYGISNGTSSSGEIFKYNFINNSETEVLKQINGYCTFLEPIGNNILCLEKDGSESRLYYYNTNLDKKNLISADIGDIWDAVPDNDDNSVYLIANRTNEANCSIYKVELNSLSIQKITYDFPGKVEKNGGMALSIKGILYFCGIMEDSANLKDEVFSFNTKDTSINIVNGRIHSGTYKVFSSDSLKQP
jgi:hypothetical protein